MVLFLLLLLSSSLMYYYFQRSQRLDVELAIWRSGNKPTPEQLESNERSLFTNPGSVFRNLPATRLLDHADDSTPDGEIADPPLVDAALDDEPPATPAPSPSPTARRAADAPAGESPERQPAAAEPVQVPSTPYAPGVEERRVAERTGQTPAPTPRATAAPRTTAPPRQTPAMRVRVPSRPTATPPARSTAPVDEIGDLLRGTGTR